MTEMLRYNEGKRRVSIFPPIVHQAFIDRGINPVAFIEEVTKVLEFGANKYALHNWKQSGSWHRCADSAVRHIIKYRSGEEIDPESGLSHLAHLGCNLCFLYEFAFYGTGQDDRWHYEDPQVLLDEEDCSLDHCFKLFLSWLDGGKKEALELAILNLADHMEIKDVD